MGLGGVEIFLGGLRFFPEGEIFSGCLRNFRGGGVEKHLRVIEEYQGGGVERYSWRLRNFQGVLKYFFGGEVCIFFEGLQFFHKGDFFGKL